MSDRDLIQKSYEVAKDEYKIRRLTRETMTSKERVIATMNHQRTDRVPIDYFANPQIDIDLKKHFGLKPNQNEELLEILGVDFRGVNVAYTGPTLHRPIKDRRVHPEWGYITKEISYGSGRYWDFCDHPLKEADIEQVANWPMPSVDDYDYDSLEDYCFKHKDKALFVGNAGLACIMNTAGFFRGMDQMFVDLMLDDEAGLLLIDRFMDIQFKQTQRILDKVGKLMDFMWIGEDLGTQYTPIISMEIFKKHILPRQKPFFDLAKAYDLPVMIHTCGSSSWSYEEYIKIGLKGVDTLQPEATNMSPQYLIDTFGKRLFYHGSISTTGALEFGTPEDVENDVKKTLEVMMPNRGYCLSPTHSIQDSSPLENVLALYESAHKYGFYE